MSQEGVKPAEEVLLAEKNDHIRLITLNQPRRLNVITSEVVVLLAKLLEKWEKDDDAQLILIKGSGRAYSAGGDLNMFYSGRASKNIKILKWFTECIGFATTSIHIRKHWSLWLMEFRWAVVLP